MVGTKSQNPSSNYYYCMVLHRYRPLGSSMEDRLPPKNTVTCYSCRFANYRIWRARISFTSEFLHHLFLEMYILLGSAWTPSYVNSSQNNCKYFVILGWRIQFEYAQRHVLSKIVIFYSGVLNSYILLVFKMEKHGETLRSSWNEFYRCCLI